MQSRSNRSSPSALSSFWMICLIVMFCVCFVWAQDDCMSLESSTACPAFKAYYISQATLHQYAFFSNVSDLASFDESMFAYVTYVNDELDCKTPEPIDAQYSISRLCAVMVHETSHSMPCNRQHQVTPQPLCRSTCETWLASVRNNSQTSMCKLDALTLECEVLPSINGSAGQCILGQANQPENCGFGNPQDACNYCHQYQDTCCQQAPFCRSALSGTVIAGIIVGSAASIALAAVLCILFWPCKTYKKYVTPERHMRKRSQESLIDLEGLRDLEDVQGPKSTQGHDDIQNVKDHSVQSESHTCYSQDEKLWDPDITMVETFYDVVHDYVPRNPDELQLVTNTTVFVMFALDDGWAYGFDISDWQGGLFPVMCVTPSNWVPLEPPLEKTDRTQNMKDPVHMAQRIEETRDSMRHSVSIHSRPHSDTRHPPSVSKQGIPKRTDSMLWAKRMSLSGKTQISERLHHRALSATSDTSSTQTQHHLYTLHDDGQ